MLNSKSTEKRILGAEASVALAPYISVSKIIFEQNKYVFAYAINDILLL